MSTEVGNATDWLKSKQLSDGSWNDNILDTAITLYVAFKETISELPSCTDGICNGDEDCVNDKNITKIDCGGSCPISCEEVECNLDTDCNTDYVCEAQICVKRQVTAETCNSDSDCDYGYQCSNGDCIKKGCTSDDECAIGEQCQSGECVSKSMECVTDSDCSSGYVCSSGSCIIKGSECTLDSDCSSGYVCSSGTCTPKESAGCTSDSDCESGLICSSGVCTTKKSTSILWIIILLIILIALGVGGYFFYQKYYKKSGPTSKKPDFRPFTAKLQPKTTQTKVQVPYRREPTLKSKIEEELDKSLKEAKKLLGKK
ncbi:MAG: hypothetical protein NT139_03085 [Candidatus Woesearchaeota archaeon]|nr:hypothetical protein [Candidatus Woesearchaeota archaeon]